MHEHVIRSKVVPRCRCQRAHKHRAVHLGPDADKPTEDDVAEGGVEVIVAHVAIRVAPPVHLLTIVPIAQIGVQ
eukprot:5742270-Prymnesium_polylepis.1